MRRAGIAQRQSGVSTAHDARSTRAPRSTIEKKFQQDILDAARLLGWFAYHPFDSRRSEPGFPDTVLVKNGRLIFAELKATAKDKPTTAQAGWLARLAQVPGIEVYVWRPEDWETITKELQA